jgi:hypothetical protein
LEHYTRQLLDRLRWRGFAHLDWIYSSKYDEYLLCEINPRLPGFSNLLEKVGFDMAYGYYADLCGITTEPFRFKKALYFEALRMPGDLSTGLYAMLKGYLRPAPFLRSYLQALHPSERVYLDIFYGSDLPLTMACWSEQLAYLFRRPFRNLPFRRKQEQPQPQSFEESNY